MLKDLYLVDISHQFVHDCLRIILIFKLMEITMGRQSADIGVMLPQGFTGSVFFRHVMEKACLKFSGDFAEFSLPSKKAFKKDYAEAVVQFEAARASSESRSEIARFMVDLTQAQLCFRGHGFDGLMSEYMSQEVQVPPLEVIKMYGKEGLIPRVPFRGEMYSVDNLSNLCAILLKEGKMTRQAAEAVVWVSETARVNGGAISLKGQKFVVMGAAAELAPTQLLLAAGATVLWIDVKSPDSLIKSSGSLAGELHYCRGVGNIVQQPLEIKAAIEAFADGDAVHMGLFAYAPGASLEWRLAATMNGIVASLKPSLVKSVSMLVSPTSAAVIQPEDLATSHDTFRGKPIWHKALRMIGQLRQQNSFETKGVAVSRAIVPLQGASYQAAQYVSKILAGESFASFGTNPKKAASQPVKVSVNVAGITKTNSLNHPVFQAAFLGAGKFGVEIFDPATTRTLLNIMNLHDILNLEAGMKNGATLFGQQVHGGVYSRAYALDPMIRVATVIGLAQKPKLLLKLLT